MRASDISDSEAFRVNTERVRGGGGTFCSNAALTNSEHADRAADESAGEVRISRGCYPVKLALHLRAVLETNAHSGSEVNWRKLSEGSVYDTLYDLRLFADFFFLIVNFIILSP